LGLVDGVGCGFGIICVGLPASWSKFPHPAHALSSLGRSRRVAPPPSSAPPSVVLRRLLTFAALSKRRARKVSHTAQDDHGRATTSLHGAGGMAFIPRSVVAFLGWSDRPHSGRDGRRVSRAILMG
jgi:hypothetical protein